MIGLEAGVWEMSSVGLSVGFRIEEIWKVKMVERIGVGVD